MTLNRWTTAGMMVCGRAWALVGAWRQQRQQQQQQVCVMPCRLVGQGRGERNGEGQRAYLQNTYGPHCLLASSACGVPACGCLVERESEREREREKQERKEGEAKESTV